LNTILTVSAINSYIASRFREDINLRGVLIRGEISDFKRYPKALYFTLKDADSVLKCVMWADSAAYLRFEPENGMDVIAEGSVSCYEKNGIYQLYVSDLTPGGIGKLALSFEQTKAKLEAAGLFDEAKKRRLPTFPKKIAVVAGENSAALRDIENILKRRNPLIEIEVFPTLVQGEAAPPAIAEAIKKADKSGADIIICGRGGGSYEDLFCFSTETVAKAVGSTKTPIISAVGHETDTSLSDFAADLRAPTPSAAAELAVPDVYFILETFEKRLMNVRPERKLEDSALILKSLERRLKNAAENRITDYEGRLARDLAKLEAVNPLSILARGYAVVRKNGVAITGINSLNAGDEIKLTMQDGELSATITSKELSNGT
jgi:exodeoxyribonuclease VII large subunit